MKKFLAVFGFIVTLVFIVSGFSAEVNAADIRANNNIVVSEDEQNLSDLYLFGNSITVNAPVNNDVVAAGQDITIENNVSGGILAGAANLRIKGDTEGSVRVAGGNVVIDGDVARDLVVAGGNVLISKSANIDGDLIIAGGELTVEGVVKGRTIVNGGSARINGLIEKSVSGNIGSLTLGPSAVIGGDLVYSSSEKGLRESGARVMGSERFTRVEEPRKAAEQAGSFITGLSVYKLIADIIITVGLIYLLGAFLKLCFARIMKAPLLSGVFGFGFLVLTPIAAMFLLILLWLGVGAFMFYGLVLLVATFIAKAFAGWFVLRWWYGRDKRVYALDWKAGVIGPIILFIIAFVPFIGWLAVAIVYLLSLGAFIWEFAGAVQAQRVTPKKK